MIAPQDSLAVLEAHEVRTLLALVLEHTGPVHLDAERVERVMGTRGLERPEVWAQRTLDAHPGSAVVLHAGPDPRGPLP